jgi:hypothetical protein
MTAPGANPGPLTLPLEVWITAARVAGDGYRGRVTARLAPTILAIGLLAAALTACDATPDPVETPPVFASEEEAFAAAEETYRAYVDAVNDVDLSDPSTFDPVFELTTGELNASDRTGLSNYHADGVQVAGRSEIRSIEAASIDLQGGSYGLAVCLDVSSIQVTDPNGNSLVDPDRVDVQSYVVTAVHPPADPGDLKLQSIAPGDGSC